MAISLSKGERVSLSKSVNRFTIGLSWDESGVPGQQFDLDVMAVMLTADGKVINEKGLVFYGQLEDPAGSLVHTGDNQTGDGDGDDEQMVINTDKVPANIERIRFFMNIHKGISRGQNFGQVRNSTARIYEGDFRDEPTEPVFIYNLEEDASSCTFMNFCDVYRYNGTWKFRAMGEGNSNTLASNLNSYGIECKETDL